MKTMSRDARKILEYLKKLSGRDYAAISVFDAESLVAAFFPNVINNIVKQIYGKSTSEDRYSIDYYIKPVVSMGKQKRAEMWPTFEDSVRDVYWEITNNYLLEDFNIDQQQILQWLCTRKLDDIRQAIKTAKSEDVHSIPYIQRIVEGIEVRRDQQLYKMDQRRDMFLTGDQNQLVVRAKVEVAHLSYGWMQTIENMELQDRVSKLRRGTE